MVALAPQHRFVCVGDRRAFESFPLEAPNVERVEVALDASPTIAASADGARSVSDMLRLTRAVRDARPDVFFSPSVYTYFPLPPGMRAVVTIHDAIAERFPQLTLPSARARLFWTLKVKLAIAQSRLVLTVSEYARRDLQRVLGIAPARLRVAVEAPAGAYHPVAPDESRAAAVAMGVPAGADWFTYVGGFNPHKRIDLILRAHAEVARALAVPPHLLLVGTLTGDVFHGESGKLRAIIAECGTEALVHWTGFVPDERLRQLHAGALATLLPSECEGFGLPAVEAAACGTPVIATTESPLPELLAGGGIFVAPGDLPALTVAMRRLATDASLRSSMGATALARTRLLTWEAAARAALAALEEAAA